MKKTPKLPTLAEELAMFNMFLTLSQGTDVTEHVKSERTMLIRWKKISEYLRHGRITALDMFNPCNTERFATRQEHIDCMVGSNLSNCCHAHYLPEEYDIIKQIYELGGTGAGQGYDNWMPAGGPHSYNRFRVDIIQASELERHQNAMLEVGEDGKPLQYIEFAIENYPELADYTHPFIVFWFINKAGQVARYTCIADNEFKSHKRKDLEKMWKIHTEYCNKVFGTKGTCDISSDVRYNKRTDYDFKAIISRMNTVLAHPEKVTIAPATEKQIKMIKNISPLGSKADTLNRYQASEIISSYYNNETEEFLTLIDWYQKRLG